MQTREIAAPVPAQIADAGKVHLGGWSPNFPRSVVKQAPKEVADGGKVRLGGWAPSLERPDASYPRGSCGSITAAACRP